MIVFLHNIRSLHNVGSIFRTADGVGVEKIYLSGITPAPVDRLGRIRPQLGKVSLGAERTVPWEKIHSPARRIKKLRTAGYKILAIEQSRKSIPYYKLPKSYILNSSVRGVRPLLESESRSRRPDGQGSAPGGRLCLLFGNEIHGLPLSILKLANRILEIPMRGKTVRDVRHPRHVGKGKESLNVAVACGIVLYHFAFGCDRRIKRWAKR